MPESPLQVMSWNAADYAANSVVQHTWARELIARFNLRGNERILDVGCGDGKVTAEISRAVPKGSVTGIDDSPQMIEFAQKRYPVGIFHNLEFQVMDARNFQFAHEFDLIFSNAALHWVDDHLAILRSMASALKPAGRLVISCGGRGNAQDVFIILRPLMRMKRWREFFRKMPMPYFFYSPEDYRKWLPQFGFRTEKVQLVPKDATYLGSEGFAAWLRTTWLPYVQRVPDVLREEFIAAAAERYVAKHPPDQEGFIHVRMVRLEIEAVKV